MEENGKKQRRKKIGVVVILVILIAAGITGLWLWRCNSGEEKKKEEKDPVTEIQEENQKKDTEGKEDDSIDFAALKAENPDIYAWIRIPGTDIDYPVLQSEEDNYYLNRTVDKKEGLPGAIYTNACSEKDFSDYNTVIYGHNMKNGTMFGALHKFEDKDFFDKNQEIDIYTEEGKLIYQIYAATAYSDVYLPDEFHFKSYSGMSEFIRTIDDERYADGMINRNETVSIEEGDKIVTLSTCIKGQDTKRYLVIGVLKECK